MASVVQSRSSQPIPKTVRDSSRYAQHGLALPAATLRALKKRGIYCQSSLTLEFQQLARRYVLRGVESGGAVVDMGRYCAYLSKEGGAVELTQIPFSRELWGATCPIRRLHVHVKRRSHVDE